MFSHVFGMGMLEILLVGAVMLMLFSPKELPNMIKSIARLYGGLRRTADEFRNQIMETEELREIRGEYHRTRHEIQNARDLAQRELNRAKLEALRSRKEVETTIKSGRSAIEGRVRSEFNEAAEVAAEAEGDSNSTQAQAEEPPRAEGDELHVVKEDANRDSPEKRDQGAA